MKKKMVVVELILIENAQWQPWKLRLQAFRPHQPGQFDVIVTVIIGHIGCDKLDDGHHRKKQDEKKGRNKKAF